MTGYNDRVLFKGHVISLLVGFFGDDHARIGHALEVLRHAEEIAARRGGCDYETLVAVALLHDVGIKPSEERYGHNTGKSQEELGPPEADRLLRETTLDDQRRCKVCEMVGNHHSPSRYDYPELVVLKEADGIVNRASSERVAP
jgi:predicted HD phosphohydrolase